MFNWFWRSRPTHEVSRYNTLVECDDGWLLHSQMKGTLLLLSDEKAEVYRRLSDGDFSLATPTFVETLKNGGFLKPAGFDERETIGRFWDENVNSPIAKALTIVTTDRCNLGCTYCYEKKTEWRMMTEEVQEQVERFLDEYLTATPTKSFGVTWFGGEPTLNMRCIERLSAYIDMLCSKLGVPWEPFIITNGTTLTPHVINRLKACKIKGLQITVDGIKEDHDALRPYLSQMKIEDMHEHQIAQRQKIDPNFGSLPIIGQAPESPKSSFEDIIRNVGHCYDAGLQVALRINVSKINKDRVEALYELAHERGWMEKSEDGGIVRVYTNAIFDGCGGACSSQMTKEEHARFELSLNRWSQERSAEAYRRNLRFTGDTCTANKNFQFVVNPSGAIIKCWHHSTDDSHAIGHITNLEFATKGSKGLDKYEFNPMNDAECYECHVLPMCMGGCKANNQFAEKGYDGNHDMGCMSTRYVLPQEIRQLYKLTKESRAKKEEVELELVAAPRQ